MTGALTVSKHGAILLTGDEGKCTFLFARVCDNTG